MIGILEIRRDTFHGSWIVSVKDEDYNEIFRARTMFKTTAWIRFYTWKYITRKFKYRQNVEKSIDL